jgi:hypothetical protein
MRYSKKSLNYNSYNYVQIPLHLFRLMNLQVHNPYYITLLRRYELIMKHQMMMLKLKVRLTFNKCSQLLKLSNSCQVLYNLMLHNY